MPYSTGTKIAVFWTLLNMVPCISLSFSFFFILVVEHFHFIIIIYIFNIIYFGHTGSSLLRSGFLQLQWAVAPLCCGAPASHSGFFYCGAWALGVCGSVVMAQGLVAPRQLESSQTRDQICVPCIGRQILIYCTTGKFLLILFYVLVFWPQGR